MADESIKNKLNKLETEVEELKTEVVKLKKDSVELQFLVLRLLHKSRQKEDRKKLQVKPKIAV